MPKIRQKSKISISNLHETDRISNKNDKKVPLLLRGRIYLFRMEFNLTKWNSLFKSTDSNHIIECTVRLAMKNQL